MAGRTAPVLVAQAGFEHEAGYLVSAMHLRLVEASGEKRGEEVLPSNLPRKFQDFRKAYAFVWQIQAQEEELHLLAIVSHANPCHIHHSPPQATCIFNHAFA